MATTYLGINMGGINLNIVNSSGGNINALYHKERFTYSFELRTINGKSYKKICFLNKSGKYDEGFLLNSNDIKNCDEYCFRDTVVAKSSTNTAVYGKWN